jgi:OmpA-OmpF porin, OOP family
MKLRALSALLGAALLSAPMISVAVEPGTVYVTPFVGFEQYSSERQMPRTTQFGIGGEMWFTEHLGLELDYMRSHDGETRVNNYDVDASRLSLDGIWSFGRFGFKSMYEPYLKAGIGHIEYDYDRSGDDQDTDLDAGAGLRIHFSDKLSARVEAKALHETQSSQTHGLYTLGFSYAFGAPAKAAPAPAPVAAVAPAAPLDSDGDGVIDDKDKCPNTPQGREVDENGCEYVLRKSEEIRLDINFETDKADIGEAYVGEVQKAAKFLKKYSQVKAQIAGHTDSTGSDAHNQKLSQRRADAVRDMLVQRFNVNPARLTAVGFGETKPVASNKTLEGRAQNRRVVAVMQAEVTEDPNQR